MARVDTAIPALKTRKGIRWEEAMARRVARMRSSAIRDLLSVTMQPDFISLAGGLPAPELFPLREFKEACCRVLDHTGAMALQYGPTDGYPPLRELLAESMERRGVPTKPDNILITCGSQQAMDLLGKLFLDSGDAIITDAPTYVGAIQAWRMYGPQFIAIPQDDDGVDPDDVEKALQQHRVKFMYVLPNFQNPAGTTLPYGRRRRLVELAAEYGCFILEDDPYGQLRFRGEELPSLISLDHENVVYMSTFSKILSPGIRLGWIVAPEPVIHRLVQAKQGADLHTSMFTQCAAYDIARTGFFEPHIERIRAAYEERCDVMLAALEEHFPSEATWTHPAGGMFLWARLPEHIDTEELLAAALQEKVAFVPGTAFYANGEEEGHYSMRLNFSNAKPEMIREGIRRLGQAIARMERASE